MINRSQGVPLTPQVQELGISRGGVYYLPGPTSDADLAIVRSLDELHMDFPFAGSRMLRDLLAAEGVIRRTRGMRRAAATSDNSDAMT